MAVDKRVASGSSSKTQKTNAIAKAEKIAAQEEARVQAFQNAKVAPAKTQKQVDAINAEVKRVTESTGNVYNPQTALTVDTQVSINPNVKTTQNYATGERVDTLNVNKSDQSDAYALLESIFTSYGLESLVPVIRGYMRDDLGVEQAKLKLKTEPLYKERFKGNELRAAKGLNVLDEASYLELENDYSETLRSYGLSDYFGIATDAKSRSARQGKMAEVIGNDISAVEFKSRISTAVNRVKEADTNTKDAFKALYGVTDTDLIKYFLNPKEGSEQLKTKAAAAEISGAAVSAGLSGTSLGTAEELAKLGVDKSTALTGYAAIAGYLPQTEFLGQIYDESGIKYDRAAAEAETFKGTASAKRKREQLAAMEEAQFGGSSGRLRTGQSTGNQGSF